MLIISISIILLTVYAGLIVYYRQSWIGITIGPCPRPLKGVDPATGNLPPATGNKQRPHSLKGGDPNTIISVIIPARNEEENIKLCLTSVLAQEYPANLFEVIVVDDFSTDDTAAVVRSFTQNNISTIALRDHIPAEGMNSYKKKAIEIAVSRAKGDLIVTTDADCIVPPTWLGTIASYYEAHTPACIAAPVAYVGEDNFLKIFQSLDFMTLQGITGAAVFKKFHNMCNGANFIYEKKAFYEVGGFSGIDNIASGDDMLLMHKISSLYPARVMYLKSTDVIVHTSPAGTLKEFLNQRIRWASKADKYTDKKITLVLILVYFFNAWMLITGLITVLYPALFKWWLGTLLAKTIIELFFLYPVAHFFKKEKLLWWFPLAQPFHILYTILAGWLGKFGSYKWKERKVK